MSIQITKDKFLEYEKVRQAGVFKQIIKNFQKHG